jgi:hypothetical protein
MRETAFEIVSNAFDSLKQLKPTTREIQEYADLNQNDHGVVTYSKSKGGDYYFLRFHDTWKQKIGGRVHVDIGYVDEKMVDDWKAPDTTHLMLDKNYAPDFVNFVKKKRGLE